MRDDIVFEELIEQIDLILNSSKPLPYHMKAERKLAEMLRHLQEIPEYDNLKQFEPLFDVESFLIHFLASADYTDLLPKIPQQKNYCWIWQNNNFIAKPELILWFFTNHSIPFV